MLSPLQNLQAFAATRPPIVIFTACLAAFAIASLSLSYYLRSGPVKNPDVILDWNLMMERISKRDMCLTTKSYVRRKPGTIAREVGHGQGPPPHNTFRRDTLAVKDNTSTVSIRLKLKLSTEAKNLPKNMNIFSGNISLKAIGFSHFNINESVTMVLDLNDGHTLVNCTVGAYCTIDPEVCVTFIGPSHLLPHSKQSKVCLMRRPKMTDATFTLLNYDTSSNNEKTAAGCAGMIISHDYVKDPSLEETLNYKEQTLMNLHLTYTSYFLFVMVMTVICYAIVRGQTKPKILQTEKAACV